MDTQATRNVYGCDLVVTYMESNDTVRVNHIFAEQGDNGRFTTASLLETLGYTTETATMQFLKNNNLHKPGKGTRCAVVLVNLCIGMVVKSVGSFILVHVLYPRRYSGYEIIDLRVRDRFYGFFLQQIHGPRIGSMSPLRHGHERGRENYPYCIEGYVYMDPSGPDFCIPLSIDIVARTNQKKADEYQKVLAEYKSLKENLCYRNEKKTSSRVRNLRKSKKSNVVYVVDSKSRVDMGDHADCLYIPVTAPFDPVACPWKKSDGSTGGM
jgi:hypothetical protein